MKLRLLRLALIAAALVLAGSVHVRGAEPVEGTASWYHATTGVAMPFCTWTLRHSAGCGWARIQSQQTGVVIVTPVIDYCECYGGSRLVDLSIGARAALGLDPELGLYQVMVERIDAPVDPASSLLPSAPQGAFARSGFPGGPVTALPDTAWSPS